MKFRILLIQLMLVQTAYAGRLSPEDVAEVNARMRASDQAQAAVEPTPATNPTISDINSGIRARADAARGMPPQIVHIERKQQAREMEKTSTTAPIQAEPGKPQNASAESQMQKAQRYREYMEYIDMENARFEKKRAEDKAMQEKRDADYESKKLANERRLAEEQKARDDARVAECKQNRKVYCDQGVEGINRAEAKLRADAEFDELRARTHPDVPRYTGNDIYIK